MSKEMLEAFRILEEDKGIKKEDIIEAVSLSPSLWTSRKCSD